MSRESVDSLRGVLESLPEPQKKTYTFRDAITELRPQIVSAVERGYTLVGLLEILKAQSPDFKNVTIGAFRKAVGPIRSRKAATTPKGKLAASRGAGSGKRRSKKGDANDNGARGVEDVRQVNTHAGLREEM